MRLVLAQEDCQPRAGTHIFQSATASLRPSNALVLTSSSASPVCTIEPTISTFQTRPSPHLASPRPAANRPIALTSSNILNLATCNSSFENPQDFVGIPGKATIAIKATPQVKIPSRMNKTCQAERPPNVPPRLANTPAAMREPKALEMRDPQ